MKSNWREVVSDPIYSTLSENDQLAVQQAYVNEHVAPHIQQSELPATHDYFKSQVDSYLTGLKEAKKQDTGFGIADIGNALQSGYGSAARGIGWAAEKVGLDDGSIQSYWDKYTKEQESQFSGRAKEARAKDMSLDDIGGALIKISTGTFESIPAIVLSAPLGAGVSTVLTKTATMLFGADIGGAGIAYAAGAASPLTFAGRVAGNAPSVIGASIGEGASAGLTSSADKRSEILNKTIDELRNTPGFVAIHSQLSSITDTEERDNTTRVMLADAMANAKFMPTLLATSTLGALAGGGVMGQVLSRDAKRKAGGILSDGAFKSAATGAAEEAHQEFWQSGSDKLIDNLQTKQYIDPTQGTWDGVPRAAIEGAIIGGAMGGVIGAADGAHNPQLSAAKKDISNVNSHITDVGIKNISQEKTSDDAIAAANELVNEPIVTATRNQVGNFSASPTGFGVWSDNVELNTLLNQEQKDLERLRSQSADKSRRVRQDSQLETVDNRVLTTQLANTRIDRLNALDEIYANENERTPAMSFLAHLENTYPLNPDPTPEEKSFIAKRDSAYQAFNNSAPEVETQLLTQPNELTVPTKTVTQNIARPAAVQISQVDQMLQDGYAPISNGRYLVNHAEKKMVTTSIQRNYLNTLAQQTQSIIEPSTKEDNATQAAETIAPEAQQQTTTAPAVSVQQPSVAETPSVNPSTDIGAAELSLKKVQGNRIQVSGKVAEYADLIKKVKAVKRDDGTYLLPKSVDMRKAELHFGDLLKSDEQIAPRNLATIPLSQRAQAQQTHHVVGDVVEIPISNITDGGASTQFKRGADANGLVKESIMDGEFNPALAAPIQLHERLDGTLKVISGRHRLDLAKRSKRHAIPAQIHREADGFTQEMARQLDIELNVKDGRGSAQDYVKYFKEFNLTREQAKADGLLNTPVGKTAYEIGTNGGENLIAAHANDAISDGQAKAIAFAAPHNERLQAVGIQAAMEGASEAAITNTVKAVAVMAGGNTTEQTDMFGFDESAMKQAKAMAKFVSGRQAEAKEMIRQLSSITNVAQNPKLAAQFGIVANDPNAPEILSAKITELKVNKSAWDSWQTNPDLIAQIKQGIEPQNQSDDSRKSGNPSASQSGGQDSPAFELNAPSKRQVLAQEQLAGKVTKEAEKEPAPKHVTFDQPDIFNTQDALFSSNRETVEPQPSMSNSQSDRYSIPMEIDNRQSYDRSKTEKQAVRDVNKMQKPAHLSAREWDEAKDMIADLHRSSDAGAFQSGISEIKYIAEGGGLRKNGAIEVLKIIGEDVPESKAAQGSNVPSARPAQIIKPIESPSTTRTPQQFDDFIASQKLTPLQKYNAEKLLSSLKHFGDGNRKPVHELISDAHKKGEMKPVFEAALPEKRKDYYDLSEQERIDRMNSGETNESYQRSRKIHGRDKDLYLVEIGGTAYDLGKTGHNYAKHLYEQSSGFRTLPDGRSVAERAVYYPDLSEGKFKVLMGKKSLTDKDIEKLKDYKFMMLHDRQTAEEKGFMTRYLSNNGGTLVPKDKFALTNIESKIKAAGGDPQNMVNNPLLLTKGVVLYSQSASSVHNPHSPESLQSAIIAAELTTKAMFDAGIAKCIRIEDAAKIIGEDALLATGAKPSAEDVKLSKSSQTDTPAQTEVFKWTKKNKPLEGFGGDMPEHELLSSVPNKSAARVKDNSRMSVRTLPDGRYQLTYLPDWGGNRNEFFAISSDLTDLITRSISRVERSDKAIKRSKDSAYKSSLIGMLELEFGDVFSFAKSTQSESRYIVHEPSGTKIRISDHRLPLHYEQPDIDLRTNESTEDQFAEIVAYLNKEEPPDVRYSKLGAAQAFYNPKDGVTYFIAEAISKDASATEMRGLALHELGVHAFNLGKGNAEFKDILRQVESMLRTGNKSVTAARNHVPNDTAPEHVTEETIAYLVQNRPDLPIIKRVLAWLRNAIRSIGKSMPTIQRIKWHSWAAKLNEDDLVFMAQFAMKRWTPSNISTPIGDAVMQSGRQQRFYSQLRKVMRDTPDRIFTTGKSVSVWLTANSSKLGIKKDEIFWSGVTDWLGSQSKVTKSDVLAYLDGNGVQVQDVMLGGALKVERRGNAWVTVDSQGSKVGRYYSQDDARANAEEGTNATKFASYQLTGGENYRELLLTLPKRASNSDKWTAKPLGKGWLVYDEKGNQVGSLVVTESAQQAIDEKVKVLGKYYGADNTNFHSPHYDQPNILAHVRFNERTDAEGKRVLFLEEIQSDWGQEGKKTGFGNAKRFAELRKQMATHEDGIDKGDIDAAIALNDIPEYAKLAEEARAANPNGRMPAAPFVTYTNGWTALALKRMTAYAAENGFDSVAWTTGEQQAARYDLSKQVREIEIFPDANGTYDLELTMPDGDTRTLRNIPEADLEDNVGKDLALKVIESGNAWLAANKEYRDTLNRSGIPESELDRLAAKRDAVQTTFSGLDLSVGGEGMKGFYDAIVHQTITGTEVGKKLGGVEIKTRPESFIQAEQRDDAWYVEVGGGSEAGPYKTKGEAQTISSFTITPELRAKIIGEGLPLFSKARPARQGDFQLDNPVPTTRSSSLPEEDFLDKSQRVAQDKMKRWENVQNTISIKAAKSQGYEGNDLHEARAYLADNWLTDPIRDDTNVYQAEGLHSGKAATKILGFKNLVLNPLIQETQRAGITFDEVSEYLKMQHAPEANERIQAIHHDSSALAFGITDEQAREAMDNYRSRDDFKTLDRIANKWRLISDDLLQMRVDNGIISRGQADAYRATFEFYIPVKGGEDTKTGTGKGMSVRAKDKRRLGHELRDEKIIENILKEYERTVHVIAKNEVGRVAGNFIREVNDEGIGTIGKPVRRQVFVAGAKHYMVMYRGKDVQSFDNMDDAKDFIHSEANLTGNRELEYSIDKEADEGRVIRQASPMLADNEFTYYENGNLIRCQLNDELLARAFKNDGVEQVNKLLEGAREFNSFLSKAYTGYSPTFLFKNPVRDAIQGAITNTGNFGAGTAAKIFKAYPHALSELSKHLRNYGVSSEVNSFSNNGGVIGGSYVPDLDKIGGSVIDSYNEFAGASDTYHRTFKEQIKAGKSIPMARTVALMKAGKAGFLRTPIIGHFLRFMEHANAVTENALRLATYTTLVNEVDDKGSRVYSDAQAAFYAKNLMNFNRKGEIGTQAGALYLFFNPSVQGTQVILSTLTNSKHKHQAQILTGMIAMSAYLIAESMRGGGDDDEMKWNKIPSSIKNKNMIFGDGETKFMLPVPYGYGIFHALGNAMSDVKHGKSAWKAGIQLTDSLFENFSPIGNPMNGEHGIYQMMPTIPKMATAPSVNENNFGSPIMPDKFGQNKPDSQTMYRNTKGTTMSGIAEGINAMTGGNKYQSGLVDVSPETLKFWISSITGGTGQFVMDSANLGSITIQGAAPEIKDIPVVKSFTHEIGVSDARRLFWEEATQAKEAADAFKAAMRNNDREMASEIMNENKPLIALAKVAHHQQAMVKKLRDLQDAIRMSDSLTLAEKREKLKVVERQEEVVYDKFISAFASNVQ